MTQEVDGGRCVQRSNKVLQTALAWALIPGLLVAAHQPKKEDGPAAQLSKAPRSAQSWQNPFAGQAEAVVAGRKLFEQHCAECRGPDARGLAQVRHVTNLG